ncbi:hypothetical protein [Lysinibacillus xylanilyticus]|uniref:hypothetical protein n=1 Tax=Lysinibacillus xylanilyticus TaxID=582475 RepID=UPI003802FA98
MKLISTRFGEQAFQSLVTLMRLLFGIGWLFAGITKITEKNWFSEPGIFIKNYLMMALDKPNVPEFYKYFIEHFALKHIMFFNYTIPIVQIIIGIVLIVGLMIIPSVLICLFMHVNFILSGNMNLISLTLYTSAFCILLFLNKSYVLSLDRYLGIDHRFKNIKQKVRKNISYTPSKAS